MKILQFINSLSAGGAEKLLVDAVIKYHEKGLDVDILILNDGLSPFLEKLDHYPKIKVKSIGVGINVYNPLHIFKLNNYFKNYDIIHVHLFPALYWAAISKLIGKTNYKLIFTEHNSTNRRRSKLFFKIADRFIYKKFNHIVTISDSVDESLRKHLGDSFINIEKIYNGIDLEEIELALPFTREELSLPEKSKLVLQVSSFTPQKNQEILIRSLQYLPKDIFLLLVGDGPMKNNCVQLSSQLGLKNRVHFLGIRKDVPRLLKSVDIIALSSHFEGLSLSSVEGMSSGKPFIASDVPGLTEVVENAGILFPDNNENMLAEIINQLFSDKDFYNETTKACLIKSKIYDINLMVANYVNLYKKSLSN